MNATTRPEEFAFLKEEALLIGFRHVESAHWSVRATNAPNKPKAPSRINPDLIRFVEVNRGTIKYSLRYSHGEDRSAQDIQRSPPSAKLREDDEADKTHQTPIVLTVNGRPEMVVQGIAEYQRLCELEEAEDIRQAILKARKIFVLDG